MESTRGFVFSQANEKHTLFIMGWWEKIKTEEEMINGKINRELNLTWPETGFNLNSWAHRGTQYYIYERLGLLFVRKTFVLQGGKKLLYHPTYFTLFPEITTRWQKYFFLCTVHNILYSVHVQSNVCTCLFLICLINLDLDVLNK